MSVVVVIGAGRSSRADASFDHARRIVRERVVRAVLVRVAVDQQHRLAEFAVSAAILR